MVNKLPTPTTATLALTRTIPHPGRRTASPRALPRATYFGPGWRCCRDRYRATRPARDPQRLYFDK